MRTFESLPKAQHQFTVHYPGIWQGEGWCTVRVYKRGVLTLIVATDESDDHQNTSLTNAVEKVMMQAWLEAGRPWPCIFAEHYRGNKRLREGQLFFDKLTADDERIVEVRFPSDNRMAMPRIIESHRWARDGRMPAAFGTPEWDASPERLRLIAFIAGLEVQESSAGDVLHYHPN